MKSPLTTTKKLIRLSSSLVFETSQKKVVCGKLKRCLKNKYLKKFHLGNLPKKTEKAANLIFFNERKRNARR